MAPPTNTEKRDSLDRLPFNVRVLAADGQTFVTPPASVKEDDPHVSGDPGILALSVRKDLAASTADTDGDNAALTTDAFGRLHVAPGYRVATVAIGSGASLSAEIDTTGRSLAAILIPSDWTLADLTFQIASASGGTYMDLYDDQNNEIRVVIGAVGAARALGLDSVAFALAPFRYIKIRSGPSAGAVNQVGAKTLTLIFKGS